MGRWISVALVVATGCGDNTPAIEYSDLRAESTRARCDYYVRCGLFADHDTCTSYFRVPDDRAIAAAIGAGKVRYDGAAARQCQDALAGASCDLTSRGVRVPIGSCELVFRGTVAAGADCGFDVECESGTCDLPACAIDSCCTGTCLAITRAPIGGPCEIDDGCVVDAFCGAEQQCEPLARAGQPCRTDGHCDYGLACIGATELMMGTCRAIPLLGERCPYMRCAELGAWCDSSRICVEVGLPGAPCTGDLDCSPYALCGASRTCSEIPAIGMPCTTSCAGEAWCDAGVCSPPQEDGAPCTSNDQCASLFCAEGMFFDQCATRPVCI